MATISENLKNQYELLMSKCVEYGEIDAVNTHNKNKARVYFENEVRKILTMVRGNRNLKITESGISHNTYNTYQVSWSNYDSISFGVNAIANYDKTDNGVSDTFDDLYDTEVISRIYKKYMEYRQFVIRPKRWSVGVFTTYEVMKNIDYSTILNEKIDLPISYQGSDGRVSSIEFVRPENRKMGVMVLHLENGQKIETTKMRSDTYIQRFKEIITDISDTAHKKGNGISFEAYKNKTSELVETN